MPNAPQEQPPAQLQPSWKMMTVLVLIVLALLSLVYFSPLQVYLTHWHEHRNDIRDRILGFGALGPIVFMLGVALLISVGVPRLPLCMIAGMTLGFWSGLLWAQLGTLIGNYILFIVARAGGRQLAQRLTSKRARFSGLIQQKGALGVILARQLPLPGVVVNFTCARVSVTHLDFLLGTLIGQLPQAIPCTLIGAGVLQKSFAHSVGLIGLAVVLAVLAWIGLRFVLLRMAGRKEANRAIESAS